MQSRFIHFISIPMFVFLVRSLSFYVCVLFFLLLFFLLFLRRLFFHFSGSVSFVCSQFTTTPFATDYINVTRLFMCCCWSEQQMGFCLIRSVLLWLCVSMQYFWRCLYFLCVSKTLSLILFCSVTRRQTMRFCFNFIYFRLFFACFAKLLHGKWWIFFCCMYVNIRFSLLYVSFVNVLSHPYVISFTVDSHRSFAAFHKFAFYSSKQTYINT